MSRADEFKRSALSVAEVNWLRDDLAKAIARADTAEAEVKRLREALENTRSILSAFVGPDDELGQSVLREAALVYSETEAKP